MGSPLLVEIIAYAPTAFYHCTHCEVAWREMGATNKIHGDQFTTSLPDELVQDYQNVSDFVHQIFNKYCDQVVVKVIDVASIEGFWKTLRYGVRRYPAVIVRGQKRFTGTQFLEAEEEIGREISLLAGSGRPQ